jgi:iron complex outermembrane receptor protein
MHKLVNRAGRALLAFTATAVATPALAELEEVVVTARKRAESSIAAPVVVTVLSAADLARFATQCVEDIAQQTPALVVGEGQTMVGGSLSLRGVSTGTANSSSDQAVSVNLDGVQVAKATLLRVGYYDLQQVEILKGPQALFFGKNSPAGIISLTSADPTDQLEASARLGYVFDPDQTFGQVVVSGPLSDTVGGRLVLYASHMKGPYDNLAEGQPGVPPSDNRAPNETDYFGRLTLTYAPTESFDLKAKGSYYERDSDGGMQAYVQRFYCATGSAIGAGTIPGLDDCKLDEKYATGDPGPAFGGLDSTFPADGRNFLKNRVSLLSLEANYDVTEHLALTSITGYFDNKQSLFGNLGGSPFALLVLGDRMEYRQFSEELRLATSYDSPINGIFGLYYDDSRHRETGNVAIFAPAVIAPAPHYDIDGETISAFGQARWQITDTVELAGGGRWTREEKSVDLTREGASLPTSPDQTYEDFSPEVTLTWRPSDALTIFGAYKEGFKSGGFNSGISAVASAGSIAATTPFEPEQARGGELGLKTILFDRTLRLEAAAYKYRYEDLQLTTFDPSTGFSAFVTNAASSDVEGVEIETEWTPASVEGLTLGAQLAYNHARYRELLATCYTRQTPEQGCNVLVGASTLQDMKDKRLVGAPDWGATLSFDFDHPIGSGGLRYRLSSNASYKSEYPTFLQDAPHGRQDSYWLLNANLSLYDDERGWEIALVGRNLTNEFYITSGFQDPLAAVLPAGVEPDILGSVNRPRDVMVQLTYTFK